VLILQIGASRVEGRKRPSKSWNCLWPTAEASWTR